MVIEPTAKALYDGCGGALCLDFVNTANRRPGLPWKDKLGGYPDLVLWSVQAGTVSDEKSRKLAQAARADPAGARSVLERARALREASYRAFHALEHGRSPAPADLRALNAELAAALAHARVEPGAEGFVWGWQRAPLALDEPLWPIARSTAELLTSPEVARVRGCASERCFWLFVDRSKNRSRRWCEMKSCGNRAKARAHRRRMRQA